MPFVKNATHLFAQFDSFCKRVIRNEARDLRMKEKRSAKPEILVQDLMMFHEIIGQQDDHRDAFVEYIHMRDKAYEVAREDLYLALIRLTQTELEIIVLLFWENMRQSEIAELHGISARTVSARRKSALSKLRQWMHPPEKKDNAIEDDTS